MLELGQKHYKVHAILNVPFITVIIEEDGMSHRHQITVNELVLVERKMFGNIGEVKRNVRKGAGKGL